MQSSEVAKHILVIAVAIRLVTNDGSVLEVLALSGAHLLVVALAVVMATSQRSVTHPTGKVSSNNSRSATGTLGGALYVEGDV